MGSSDLWKPGDAFGALPQRERDALEFAGYRRGLNAALRLLERETPLAAGSIAQLRGLIASVTPRVRPPRGRRSEDLPLEGC